MTGKILYGILLLLCADCKDFFSAQQIFLMLAFPPKSFVAVEPLGLSQALVVLAEMETAYAEADSDKQYNSGNGIDPFGDCRPYCVVDKVVYAAHERFCGGFKYGFVNPLRSHGKTNVKYGSG